MTEETCRACHAEVEELRNAALDALLALIDDIAAAVAADSTDPRLSGAGAMQRRAQFFVDFVAAENSMGFHVPEEAARILARSIDASHQGQVAMLRVRSAINPRWFGPENSPADRHRR